MKVIQWVQVAALASAITLAGTAVACDTDQTSSNAQPSKNEAAGAAVSGNSPAQLGTGLTTNSSAQLGSDSSKTTVPNDSETQVPDADAAKSTEPM